MKIKFKFIVFVLLTLQLNNVVSQDYYDNEYLRLGIKVSTIPSFLDGFSTNGSIFFGISDPFIDSTKGAEQAIRRAQALAAMSKGVFVKNFTSGYSIEGIKDESGTYQSMQVLEPAIIEIPDVQVIDTIYTAIQEAIVRVKLKQTATKNFQCTLSRFIEEYLWNGMAETNEIINFNIKVNSNDEQTLVFTKQGNNDDAYSEINKQTFTFPNTKYLYKKETDSSTFPYRYGLWINILKELTLLLDNYSKLSKGIIDTRSETPDSENFNQISKNLNQGKSKNILSFNINSLKFEKGEIKLDMKINILQ